MNRRPLVAIVVWAVGLLVLPVSAQATSDTFILDPPVTASGPSPFAGRPFGEEPDSTVYPGTESSSRSSRSIRPTRTT